MKINRLLPLAAVLAMGFAHDASALDVEPGDKIYVIGTMNGWDINQTEYVLHNEPLEEGQIYRGLIRATPEQGTFLRFYTAFGDWDKNSIGWQVNDERTPFNLNGGSLSTEFVEGKGAWELTDAAGWIEVTVDFATSTVTFEPVTFGTPYFTSAALEETENVPNDFDYSSVAYDGTLRFHFQAEASTGRSYSFGAHRIWNAEGFEVPDREMDAETNRATLPLYPNISGYHIAGCTTDNPVTIVPDIDNATMKVQRASFDPSNLTFELREDRIDHGLAPGYGYSIYEFMNIDKDLDFSLINVACDESIEIIKEANNIIFAPGTPGTFTFTVTSEEIPDKEVSFEMLFLPLWADEYTLTTTDGLRTGLVLTRGENNTYTATLTVPEGEGDFSFWLDGPEEYVNDYRIYGDGTPLDLTQESLTVGAGHWNSEPFVIPAEYRGQTFDFKFYANGNTLEINHEGYVRPLIFEWIDADAPIAARLGRWNNFWPYDYLRIDDEINVEDIFITIEPEQEGIQMQGPREFVVSEDYSGPAELTIKVTTPELQERGVVLEKTLKIIPHRPSELVFVSGDERIGDLTLLPLENDNWIFEGNITIPEGEGDFRFRLSDADLSGFYNYGNGENINLTQGIAQVNMWEGNTDEVTVPAEFRGQTYAFTYNFNNYKLTIAAEGIDPDAVTVVPSEANPAVLTTYNTSVFRFDISGTDLWNVQLRVEGDAWVQNWYVEESTDDYVSYRAQIYTENEGTNAIVIGKEINGEFREYYRQAINSEFVSVQSFKVPESVILHEGEFATLQAQVEPYSNSMELSFRIENDADKAQFIPGNDYTLLTLAQQEGTVYMKWYANDHQGNESELATTTVTIIPREAAAAEHIFHATLGLGEEMSLKLSAHADRSYAEATWSSSNPEIASVDENGTVHALSDGTAIITADCGDHKSYMGIIAGAGFTEAEAGALKVPVRAYGHNGTIYVTGAPEGSAIRVFDAAGKTRATKTANGSADKFAVGSGVFVVSAGNEVFKLAL